jgi:hypothetical protein
MQHMYTLGVLIPKGGPCSTAGLCKTFVGGLQTSYSDPSSGGKERFDKMQVLTACIGGGVHVSLTCHVIRIMKQGIGSLGDLT